MFPNIFPFSSLTSYLSLLTSHMIAFTHVWWMRLNVMYTMQIKIQTIESSTYSSHSTLTSKYFMSWLYLIFLWIVDIALILVQSQWGRGHVTKALCMRGYAVVGKLHSSHLFKEPHPTVYETTRATRKQISNGWNVGRWKFKVCKVKGLIVHPMVWEHLCGILKVSIGFPKFPMEFPGGKRRSQCLSPYKATWMCEKILESLARKYTYNMVIVPHNV